MKKAGTMFIKNLRYLCLVGVIAIGLMTIVGTGGGGGGGGETPSNTPPTASITSPTDGSTYTEGDTIIFSGTGDDPEDGPLTGGSLVWTSSRDGQLETGIYFTRDDLSVGTHTITLTAADSQGATGSDSVSITMNSTFEKIEANPGKGFYWPYLLYVPPSILRKQLLVIPNNTGYRSDDFSVHENAAEDLMRGKASWSDSLGAPFVVPIFPRPDDDEIDAEIAPQYLGRGTLETTIDEWARHDLQLLAMIDDAKERLASIGIESDDRILIWGQSASGLFSTRFVGLHPEKIQAAAIGCHGWSISPAEEWDSVSIPYPYGVGDLEELVGQALDLEAFKEVPIYYFIGELDDNGWALHYYIGDDNPQPFYDWFDATFGTTASSLFNGAKEIYNSLSCSAVFVIYPGVGHEITPEMDNDALAFLATGGGGGGSSDLLVDVPSEIDFAEDNYLPIQVESIGIPISDATADLSDIGASQSQTLNDEGQNGDEIAGDGIWSYVASILWVPENEASIKIKAIMENGQELNVTESIPITEHIQFTESDQMNTGNPEVPVEGWQKIEDIRPEYVLDPDEYLSFKRNIHGREVTVVFDDGFDFSKIAGYDADKVADWCFKTFETFWNIFDGFPYQSFQLNFIHDSEFYCTAFSNGVAITDACHNPMSLHEMFHAWAGQSYEEYGYILPDPPSGDDRRIIWVNEGACHYNALRVAPGAGEEGTINTYFYMLELFLNDTYPEVPLSEIESGQDPDTAYNKGCAVYYLLDKMIVELTNGESNIEDLWRYLYYNYGVNWDNPDDPDPDPTVVNPNNQPPFNYRQDKVFSALLEVTGHEFDSQLENFWAKYVDGTDPLPDTGIFYVNHNLASY